MYASSFPGLSPRDFVRPERGPAPFPLSAPRQQRYYRARNALYHLLRALDVGPGAVVLAPDYHHGNEVAAVRATGAQVRFFPVDRELRPDLEVVRALCREGPKALLVIHYLGWPQPIEELATIAREHGVPLIEDCALALLSARGEQPLGTFGDFSLFCLYKTLPVPNGAILVDNAVSAIAPRQATRPCGLPSSAGRTAERLTDWLRNHCDPIGRPLAALKRGAGHALTLAGVERWPTGDSGFELDGVDLRMSPLARHLVRRFDYAAIHAQRRDHFAHLRERLIGRATLLFETLPDGVCPMFFPVLVSDKRAVVRALHARGVAAIEFWNDGDPAARRPHSDAMLLRRHVIELPVHQDLDPDQLDLIADALVRVAGPAFVPSDSGNGASRHPSHWRRAC